MNLFYSYNAQRERERERETELDFEVLITVTVVTPCSPVEFNRRFGITGSCSP
jgi:hypothetical protein